MNEKINKLLKTIKQNRQLLKSYKKQHISNSSDLSTILLLIVESSLQSRNIDMTIRDSSRTTTNVMKTENDFKLIKHGEVYTGSALNYKEHLIPVNYSAFRFYNTKRGPFIFQCEVECNEYPKYSVIINRRNKRVYFTNNTEWEKFREFFGIEMDLLEFFGISRNDVQQLLNAGKDYKKE
ncbi:hypothetical protein CDIK_0745 [Cucumispora dikerogammari]|nr:hypothetical protein CDIK_0745 [Cucumispora dikerogammari]